MGGGRLRREIRAEQALLASTLLTLCGYQAVAERRPRHLQRARLAERRRLSHEQGARQIRVGQDVAAVPIHAKADQAPQLRATPKQVQVVTRQVA